MTRDLLPCPFCGSIETEIEHDPFCFSRQAGAPDGYRVRCVSCAGQTCWWHDRREAVEKWNTRAKGGER